jgi:phytol kinase
MLAIIVYIALYCLSFFLLEVLKRKQILSGNWTRRIIHLGAALIACTFPSYLTLSQIVILCIVLFVAMIFSKRVSLLSHIHTVSRKTWGELFYPIGVMVPALLFLPLLSQYFIVTVLILGISDLLANIVGTYAGKYSFIIFSCRKTIEGGVAFFVSAFVLLIIFEIPIFVGLGIAFAATLVELFSPYGSDNLTVPIVVSILLTLLV